MSGATKRRRGDSGRVRASPDRRTVAESTARNLEHPA
ncbi:hypothetical protein ABH925_000068 [Streptacidiphilus sp. EB129]